MSFSCERTSRDQAGEKCNGQKGQTFFFVLVMTLHCKLLWQNHWNPNFCHNYQECSIKTLPIDAKIKYIKKIISQMIHFHFTWIELFLGNIGKIICLGQQVRSSHIHSLNKLCHTSRRTNIIRSANAFTQGRHFSLYWVLLWFRSLRASYSPQKTRPTRMG